MPALEQNDIEVEIANGVLAIRGKKKAETEDKDRLFSEGTYAPFELGIPVDKVEQDKVNASFKNGMSTVTLPKSSVSTAERAQDRN